MIIPRDVSRATGGVQITEGPASARAVEDRQGYWVQYGGSLGAKWFPTEAEAQAHLAEWAEQQATKLEQQAQNLRHIAALCG